MARTAVSKIADESSILSLPVSSESYRVVQALVEPRHLENRWGTNEVRFLDSISTERHRSLPFVIIK